MQVVAIVDDEQRVARELGLRAGAVDRHLAAVGAQQVEHPRTRGFEVGGIVHDDVQATAPDPAQERGEAIDPGGVIPSALRQILIEHPDRAAPADQPSIAATCPRSWPARPRGRAAWIACARRVADVEEPCVTEMGASGRLRSTRPPALAPAARIARPSPGRSSAPPLMKRLSNVDELRSRLSSAHHGAQRGVANARYGGGAAAARTDRRFGPVRDAPGGAIARRSMPAWTTRLPHRHGGAPMRRSRVGATGSR